MQPRHQLAALIQSVEDANGWSDPDVADRARQRGHTISKSNISRLRLEPVRTIKGDAIKALAAGLGISPLDIADAALASMGIHRTRLSGDDVETAIRRDPLLADTQRRMLLVMLQEMRDTDEDQGTKSTQGSTPHDGEAGTDRAPMKPPAWHGKSPEELSDEELREAAGVDEVWAEYVRTQRPELADWDF